jgi:hypothetical protein
LVAFEKLGDEDDGVEEGVVDAEDQDDECKKVVQVAQVVPHKPRHCYCLLPLCRVTFHYLRYSLFHVHSAINLQAKEQHSHDQRCDHQHSLNITNGNKV